MDTTKALSRPSVAIFCTSLQIGKEPITSQYYWDAYLDLLLAIKARGADAYFATGNQSYLGRGLFATAYTTDERIAGPEQLRRVRHVRADPVLERAESDPFRGRDITVINPESVRRIANNKIEIFRAFPSLQPESRIVTSATQLRHVAQAMPGDKIVVKEPDGYGGDAVYIGAKADVLTQLSSAVFPLLVQKFLDTSGGVPGHAPGVHDVRLEICGGNITSYQVRIAKPGALHSNVSQGGSKSFLPLRRVPSELAAMVRQIDHAFAPAPCYYSADFVHSTEGWKLIELNDYVGFDPVAAFSAQPADRREATAKFARLAAYLAGTCESQSRRSLASRYI